VVIRLKNPFVLLLLQAIAFWPVWRWYAARITDSSDDAWGWIALATAGLMLARFKNEWNEHQAKLWLPALLVDGAPLALAALVLPASGVGVYVGATFAMVQDRVDARARAFSAAVLLVVTNLVGAGLGPLLIGLASDALGSRTPGHALTRALLLVPVFLLWSAWHYACAARAAPD
jgi:hypothetical protein